MKRGRSRAGEPEYSSRLSIHASVIDGPAPHLGSAIFAHALLRIAGSADAVLVGLFLALLSRKDAGIQASLAGLLGATAYGAELIASVPLGLTADLFPARSFMPLGALTSALGTRLFAATVSTPVFFASRAIQGLGIAAVTPPLLGLLAHASERQPRRRARVMSLFELSLLAGIALGGVVGSQLWARLHSRAFGAVALLEVACAGLLFVAVPRPPRPAASQALPALRAVLRHPFVRRLAPSWICVNVVVGLWLGPTLTFLLTERPRSSQYLDGLFWQAPQQVGWVFLSYAVVFAAGVLIWGRLLPRFRPLIALRIALYAMLGASFALYGINHAGQWGSTARTVLLVPFGLLVMIESGFTPAALALLAHSLEAVSAKGAAMGIYSMLLGLGAIAGSLLAAALGTAWQVDGLILGTVMVAVVSLLALERVPDQASEWAPACEPSGRDGERPHERD
ncbi:MAG: MFS transporter [Steroidobacteraceae bacterium]